MAGWEGGWRVGRGASRSLTNSPAPSNTTLASLSSDLSLYVLTPMALHGSPLSPMHVANTGTARGEKKDCLNTF